MAAWPNIEPAWWIVKPHALSGHDADQYLGDNCHGEERLSVYSTARELLEFMRIRKKLWLLPIVTVLVVLAGLLVLAEGSALAPFIYSVF